VGKVLLPYYSPPGPVRTTPVLTEPSFTCRHSARTLHTSRWICSSAEYDDRPVLLGHRRGGPGKSANGSRLIFGVPASVLRGTNSATSAVLCLAPLFFALQPGWSCTGPFFLGGAGSRRYICWSQSHELRLVAGPSVRRGRLDSGIFHRSQLRQRSWRCLNGAWTLPGVIHRFAYCVKLTDKPDGAPGCELARMSTRNRVAVRVTPNRPNLIGCAGRHVSRKVLERISRSGAVPSGGLLLLARLEYGRPSPGRI